ncbi:MAG: DUF3833 family protein, partial [Desulforhopalus sp.]
MRLMLLFLLTAVISSCSAVDMKKYSANTPAFDMYEYFSGHTTGWGIV